MVHKLYPPIIANTLPAFYRDSDANITITVPFNMNNLVSSVSVKSMYLKLTSVTDNTKTYYTYTTHFNLTAGIAQFVLDKQTAQNISVGLFYKAQLAYCGTAQPDSPTKAGYFSTVGMIKCIAKPTVRIAGLSRGSTNNHQMTYIGEYIQDHDTGDASEKVYSYQFIILNEDGSVFETSGVQLHNTNNDSDNWSSNDSYTFTQELDAKARYYISYTVTTINNAIISSPQYVIINGYMMDMPVEVQITPTLNFEEGYIQLALAAIVKKQIGASDYSTSLFDANSVDWKVPVGSTVTKKFRNYNSGTGAYWENFLIVLFDSGDASRRVFRPDNYGWKGDLNTNHNLAQLGWSLHHTWDWSTFVQDLNGASVELSVSNYGTTASITAKVTTTAGKQYIQSYSNIAINGDLWFYLSVEHSYLILEETETVPQPYTGLFVISRSSSNDNYGVWQEVVRFNLQDEPFSSRIFNDFIIAQGVTYKYRIQQYNRAGLYSQSVYSPLITADFEDIFLYDGHRQLKVRFNPKVNSFKVNTPEQKVETIGNKYPFIFRNGQVYYHEFPISGLISCSIDEAKMFLSTQEIAQGKFLDNINPITTSHEGRIKSSIYPTINQSSIHDDPNASANTLNAINSTTSLEDNTIRQQVMSERQFKTLVLEWLTNGEVKLFKSPVEGMFLVRLVNTSLNPEDKLGRMLHTFSTTAYEIAELTPANLQQYNLIQVEQFMPVTKQQLFSKTWTPETGSVVYSTMNNIIQRVEVSNCVLGDKLLITYATGDTNSYVIGATGSYIVPGDSVGITEVAMECTNNLFQPRLFTFMVTGEVAIDFDQIKNVNYYTSVGRTYYGCDNPEININTTLLDGVVSVEDLSEGELELLSKAQKIKLIDIEQLRMRPREIIPLYQKIQNDEKVFSFNMYDLAFQPYQNIEASLNPYFIYAIYEGQESADQDLSHIHPSQWELKGYLDLKREGYNIDELLTAVDLDMFVKIKSSGAETETLFDLANIGEYTLHSLGDDVTVEVGAGSVVEPVIQMQITTYTVESTNAELLALQDSIQGILETGPISADSSTLNQLWQEYLGRLAVAYLKDVKRYIV